MHRHEPSEEVLKDRPSGKRFRLLQVCILHCGNIENAAFQYVEKFEVFVKLNEIDIFARKVMSVEINVDEYFFFLRCDIQVVCLNYKLR